MSCPLASSPLRGSWHSVVVSQSPQGPWEASGIVHLGYGERGLQGVLCSNEPPEIEATKTHRSTLKGGCRAAGGRGGEVGVPLAPPRTPTPGVPEGFHGTDFGGCSVGARAQALRRRTAARSPGTGTRTHCALARGPRVWLPNPGASAHVPWEPDGLGSPTPPGHEHAPSCARVVLTERPAHAMGTWLLARPEAAAAPAAGRSGHSPAADRLRAC